VRCPTRQTAALPNPDESCMGPHDLHSPNLRLGNVFVYRSLRIRGIRPSSVSYSHLISVLWSKISVERSQLKRFKQELYFAIAGNGRQLESTGES
jgi:hypothetical protein